MFFHGYKPETSFGCIHMPCSWLSGRIKSRFPVPCSRIGAVDGWEVGWTVEALLLATVQGWVGVRITQVTRFILVIGYGLLALAALPALLEKHCVSPSHWIAPKSDLWDFSRASLVLAYSRKYDAMSSLLNTRWFHNFLRKWGRISS